MKFTDAQLAYLASQRLGRLATVDPRGAPQNNPVSFRYNPDLGTIDIGGRAMGDSCKFRNIAANPHVAFVVDDIASYQPWKVRCVEIRGAGRHSGASHAPLWAHAAQGPRETLREVRRPIRGAEVVSLGVMWCHRGAEPARTARYRVP
jgi:PPOX class F420-dependent enzyme/OxyR family protein